MVRWRQGLTGSATERIEGRRAVTFVLDRSAGSKIEAKTRCLI